MEIIHIVLGKANPERMNGVNKVVYEMAVEQKLYGMDVTVWGITADTAVNYGDRIFDTRLFKAAKTPFSLPEGFYDAVSKQSADTVFHIHGGWVPVFATISSCLRKAGFRYVFTPHGAYNTIAMKRNRWVKKIYYSLFEKKLLSGASVIHHIGSSETAGLNKIYSGDNIYELPYGFKSAANPAGRTSTGKFVTGFIGRLDTYTKGLDLLINAFRQCSADMPQAVLWITGDSPERPALEQMAADLIEAGKAVFTGSKFGPEKAEILSKMDIFVHPSRNEGLPASILEAAASGIPCIVTEATNLAGEIKKWEAGIAIPDEDVSALAKAIVTLYKKWQANELKATGDNGIKMVQESFGWNHLLARYQAMYLSALN